MMDNTNRRALLGKGVIAAAAIATVGVSIPVTSLAAAPSRTAWETALADLARSEAALEATGPAYDRGEELYRQMKPKRPTLDEIAIPLMEAGRFGVDDLNKRAATIQADFKRRDDLAKHLSGFAEADMAQAIACKGTTIALKALMLCPAPDFAAVAYKLRLAIEESIEMEDIAPVLADLGRLGNV